MSVVFTGARGQKPRCVCVKRPMIRSIETGAPDPKSAAAFVDAGLKLARGLGVAKQPTFLEAHGGKVAIGGVIVAGVVALKALKVI